ncbi:MAG: LicD family protein [Clostridia bacterium]|nr:LicD family protein [Clostridia bacterium]
MTHEDFLRLQQTQLEIMDEIHRLCMEHNIPYYIVGGTGIGAIRHHGFIPWDVDIDIAMLRPDYDRFRELCRTELDPRYRYMDYTNTPNFIRPHALISKCGTKLASFYDRYNARAMDLGIFVDILPLDNAPDTAEERARHGKEIWRLKMRKEHKLATCYSASLPKKIVKEARRFLMFGVTIDKLNRQLDAAMRRYNDTPTQRVCSMAGKYPYETECVPVEYFGTPVLMPFEGRSYCAPQNLPAYLEHIYGDYMKLPPVEEQKECLDYFQSVQFAPDKSDR